MLLKKTVSKSISSRVHLSILCDHTHTHTHRDLHHDTYTRVPGHLNEIDILLSFTTIGEKWLNTKLKCQMIDQVLWDKMQYKNNITTLSNRNSVILSIKI